jgi:hypothetical protein
MAWGHEEFNIKAIRTREAGFSSGDIQAHRNWVKLVMGTGQRKAHAHI